MLGILAALGAFIIAALIFAAGLERDWWSAAGKASSSWLVLSFFDFETIQMMYRMLLYRVLIAVCIACGCYFFITSNHFVLSLDIIFFFSTLMLIMHHTLKMIRILPEF